MNKLVILGASGYGNTVKDIVTQLGYEVIQLDDQLPDYVLVTF